MWCLSETRWLMKGIVVKLRRDPKLLRSALRHAEIRSALSNDLRRVTLFPSHILI